MIASGTSHAAITVVNALPLGIGAAVGVAWPARASARLLAPSDRSPGVTVAPRSSSTPVVRCAARAALERWGPVGGGIRLRVRSTIPRAKGLKSSSAVASSVVAAVAGLSGRAPSPLAVGRVAAEAGRRAGVSATGALDDALAGLESGGVVTDNRTDRCLRRFDVDAGLGVVLWIPPGRHPPSPSVQRAFARRQAIARRAVAAALDGGWVEAMRRNSSLVEAVLRYRYDALHRAAAGAGAVASGVTGLGPTFAAIAPLGRLGRVARALPTSVGRRATVRLLRRNTEREDLS